MRRVHQRFVAGFLLLWRYTGAQELSFRTDLGDLSPLSREECPSKGDLIFRKLRDGEQGIAGHKNVQHVEMQVRGEPKSGTTFMYQWGVGALFRTCLHLQNAYGKETCAIGSNKWNVTLSFDPSRATDGEASCVCDDVERATITLLQKEKHVIPFSPDCGMRHVDSFARQTDNVCTPLSGEAPTNQAELWDCVREAKCRIADDRLQMVVMRDPRPVAVSAYFHLMRFHPSAVRYDSVDDYVLALLPTMTKWISVRYLLFVELSPPDTYSLSWYNDSLADPVRWHQGFLSSVGIRLPELEVMEQANAASKGGAMFGVHSKGVDQHADGSREREGRSFENELRATTVIEMDKVLRLWLPPALLEKLGL